MIHSTQLATLKKDEVIALQPEALLSLAITAQENYFAWLGTVLDEACLQGTSLALKQN